MYTSNFSTPFGLECPLATTSQLLYPIERIDFTLLHVKLRWPDAGSDVQLFALSAIRTERTIFP